MKKMSFCLFSLFLCTGFALTFAEDGASCGGTDELSCDAGEICIRRFGCDPTTEGTCRSPEVCDDPVAVCGCDGEDYVNACEALVAGTLVRRDGVCDGSICAGAFGLSCDPGDTCLIRECGFDPLGTCVPTPTECPEQCRPICACDGVTYRNECEAIRDGFFGLSSLASLSRPGRCNEVQGIHFLSAEMIEWESTPGASSYNVYLNGDVYAAESSGATCQAAGLQTNTWAIPSVPQLAELWEIEVTAQFPEGEGPMGIGSLCGHRQAAQLCSN